MYKGSKRAEISPMRYHPKLKAGVAIITVSAAAITRKPSVACQDQSAHTAVQIRSHQRAA